ncbi:Aspartic peptidase domain superfamily [Sesbania bispinosa]|nr:Aspartic peptidase domain superfamily [Sesbania bispinosa]
MLLVAEEEDDEPSVPQDVQLLDQNPIEGDSIPNIEANLAQLSLNALSREGAAETIRVVGQVGDYQVQVLVDGGSTHNFVQDRVAKFLGLSRSPMPLMKVIVGSGAKLTCSQVCDVVDIIIQGHSFKVDLYVLVVDGYDVILGAQWLKQLGPVIMDYEQLTMKFVRGQLMIEFKGETSPQPESISIQDAHDGPLPSQVEQLPADSVDNSPVITPLAILGFKTSFVNQTPTRLALVQWLGLSPDDTSWENWDELQAMYNFEDKVVSVGESIVTHEASEASKISKTVTRPKRLTCKPKAWVDYVFH